MRPCYLIAAGLVIATGASSCRTQAPATGRAEIAFECPIEQPSLSLGPLTRPVECLEDARFKLVQGTTKILVAKPDEVYVDSECEDKDGFRRRALAGPQVSRIALLVDRRTIETFAYVDKALLGAHCGRFFASSLEKAVQLCATIEGPEQAVSCTTPCSEGGQGSRGVCVTFGRPAG